MGQSKQSKPAPGQRGSFGLPLLIVLAAVFLYVAFRPSRSADEPPRGVRLPPLEVAGWFNTNTPLRNEDLRGRVVLVDCWFVGCGPCRAAMPHLVEFHNRFRDSGLVVIGLTPDSGADVADAKAFVQSVPGLDWPIGYGAEIPLEILGVQAYPTLILFDKSGNSTWVSHGIDGLEEAATAALAEE